MNRFYRFLKALTPVVLGVFFVVATAAPSQENYEYHVITPTQVNKGDTFQLTVSSSRERLDKNNVYLVLPAGIEYSTSAILVYPDGSLTYQLKAGQVEGAYTIHIQVLSAMHTTSLSQEISVQKSYLEKAQPFLVAVGLVALVVIIGGGLAKIIGL